MKISQFYIILHAKFVLTLIHTLQLKKIQIVEYLPSYS